jgi:hypothetical protein
MSLPVITGVGMYGRIKQVCSNPRPSSDTAMLGEGEVFYWSLMQTMLWYHDVHMGKSTLAIVAVISMYHATHVTSYKYVGTVVLKRLRCVNVPKFTHIVPESSLPHTCCTRILSSSHLLYQNPLRLTPVVPESSPPHTCCTRILSASHLLYQNPLRFTPAVLKAFPPQNCCTRIISAS